MLGPLRVSSLVLSLLMATSTICAPVALPSDSTGGTGTSHITVLPGITNLLDKLFDCLICGKPTQPSLPLPTCDTTDQDGLAYALWQPSSSGPFSIQQFKQTKPTQQGFTSQTGFANRNPMMKFHVYGGAATGVKHLSVNHRGYLVAPTTGKYTFTCEVDDICLVWLGDNATNGRYTRLNAILEAQTRDPPKSITLDLVEGVWYPFRSIGMNDQGPTFYKLTVRGPDGKVLIGPDATETPNPYFKQFSCDGRFVKFQPWGEETA